MEKAYFVSSSKFFIDMHKRFLYDDMSLKVYNNEDAGDGL